jgi:hypothetical protein
MPVVKIPVSDVTLVAEGYGNRGDCQLSCCMGAARHAIPGLRPRSI